MRALTRQSNKPLGDLAAERNRIQHLLEVTNVKAGNIVSDVFGISGQGIVSVLISGEVIAFEPIAEHKQRRLRQRIPEPAEALQEQVSARLNPAYGSEMSATERRLARRLRTKIPALDRW